MTSPRSPAESQSPDPGRQEANRRLHAAALAALPFEVAIVDRHGFILFGNERWHEFASENGGDGANAYVGQSYFEVVARGMNEGAPGAVEAYALLEDALDGREHDREVVYPCGSPEVMRWFSMRASGYRAEGGGRYAVVTHEDITDRVDAQRRTQDQAAEVSDVARRLRRRNHDLESFGHMVSHDLRAPLRALDVLCDVVVETLPESVPEATQNALANIRREVARISVLVEGLLSLSRVSQRDLARERVDLSAVAHDVVRALRRAHPERDAEVHIQEGLVAEADPALARLLLVNLLSNAWKYTATREKAIIEVGCEDTARAGPAFFVRDNGIGFALSGNAAAALFEPFRRTPEAARFEGHGIGLATVARIVERHGGRVWAEGAPGRGATFYFTLGDGSPDAPTPEEWRGTE